MTPQCNLSLLLSAQQVKVYQDEIARLNEVYPAEDPGEFRQSIRNRSIVRGRCLLNWRTAMWLQRTSDAS